MTYAPLSLDILRQACLATGDRFEIVDTASAFLARVSRGTRFFFADAGFGTVYPLNPHFAAELARDKAYTADVLRAAGVAAIEGARFYADAADGGRYAKSLGPAAALAYAEARGYPLFAKLNRGAHGRLARRIEGPDALVAYMREARAVEHMFLLQPLIEEPEARIWILDGRARFLYRRDRALIVGDGIRTIAELIATHASDPRLAADPTGLDAVADLTRALSRARRALGDVPAEGETVYAADAANLAQGGHLAALDLAPSDAVQAWARKVAAASGLRVLGADVFFERLDDPSTYRVIELNGNPSLSGLWRAGERDAVIGIWRDVLDRHFKYPESWAFLARPERRTELLALLEAIEFPELFSNVDDLQLAVRFFLDDHDFAHVGSREGRAADGIGGSLLDAEEAARVADLAKALLALAPRGKSLDDVSVEEWAPLAEAASAARERLLRRGDARLTEE